MDNARPGVQPGTWISEVDSDAPGFRKNLVGLGYLTPPKGVDFQAAANYWLDAAVKVGLLPEDAEFQFSQRNVPRRRSRSASRGRGASRGRAGGAESQVQQKQHSVENRAESNQDGAANNVAAQSVRGGEHMALDRPILDDAAANGTKFKSQHEDVMKGIVPAGAGWRGKLWGEIQQGIIVMMMRGWDLRLNTRVRLILAMSAKVIFEVIGVGNGTLIQEECSVLGIREKDVTCTSWGSVVIALWFATYASINVASLVLACIPSKEALAIRIQPWTMTASVLPLPLHKFGFIFGGMSMFGGIPDSGHFLEYRAFYGWVFSAIAPLYINSGRPYPGRVEALVVVLPGLCYGIVSLLYLYRIDFFKDNLPEGYELPTAWEWVGAVLLTFVAPTSYCAFTFMLHGDFVSRVNKPNAGSQTVDIFRGSATVLLCWLASLLGLGLACFQLLGEPIGVWPWLDRIVWSQDFTLLVLMIISTLAFTTIRNVGQINRYSRDLLLRKMLPLDAANAVLQGIAENEVEQRERGRTRRPLVGRGRGTNAAVSTHGMTTDVDGLRSDGANPSSDTGVTSPRGAPAQYSRLVKRLVAGVLELPQIAALAVREPVNESAGAVQELDATVDAVLDKGGALRLETGSPSQVLFVLNIDGSAEAAEERALVVMEALYHAFQDLPRTRQWLKSHNTGPAVRCRAALASGDSLVTVAGTRRPLLRFLGPVQNALALLASAPVGSAVVSMSAYGGLDEDLKHLLTAHTVYRGQHQEEAFMLSLASPSGNQTVSMVAMSRKQQSD